MRLVSNASVRLAVDHAGRLLDDISQSRPSREVCRGNKPRILFLVMTTVFRAAGSRRRAGSPATHADGPIGERADAVRATRVADMSERRFVRA